MNARQLQREKENLREAIPSWRNWPTELRETGALRDYALSIGFDAMEINTVVDPMAVLVLREAWKSQ